MSPLTDNMTKQEVIEEFARVLAKIIRRELSKKRQYLIKQKTKPDEVKKNKNRI